MMPQATPRRRVHQLPPPPSQEVLQVPTLGLGLSPQREQQIGVVQEWWEEYPVPPGQTVRLLPVILSMEVR